VLVENAGPETVSQLERIPEIKKILPVDVDCDSDISQIVKVGTEAALGKIDSDESFAIRTTRRGRQDYSSIDVNIALGDSICKALGCDVNLNTPDKAVYVEIVGKKTYISILPGRLEHKKRKAGTTGTEIASRTSIVQLAYLYQSDISTSMGHRIGRAAQAFGVKELVLAIQEKTVARDLMRFVDGVIKGRETRFKKQKSITSGKADRVPIYVADLYQIVRERQNEPIIVTSALGDPLSQCAERIKGLFNQKRVNIFIGSRQGIPTGIFRFADVVVDLCPGLTYATEHGIPAAIYATEHGIPAAIVAIAACIQEE
jgi:tRNA acetyltransferase TAN1